MSFSTKLGFFANLRKTLLILRKILIFEKMTTISRYFVQCNEQTVVFTSGLGRCVGSGLLYLTGQLIRL